MSKVSIEINEKSSLDRNARQKELEAIAKVSTDDLKLLGKLARLNPIKIMMIKNHPMVKKYL